MSKLIVSCLLICVSLELLADRQVTDFNHNWRFHLGHAESGQLVKHDDSDWQSLRLPHDWAAKLDYSIENTASSTGFKPGGIGWYRKHFELTKADLKNKIWLEFDGVYNNAQIWVNGHFAAERPNGYSSFAVPLDEFAKAGSNIIAVKVDHRFYADSRWYTGSGIYRSVRMVKTDTVHIPMWGASVTTTQANSRSAELAIKVKLEGLQALSDKTRLNIEIVDDSGLSVASQSLPLRLNSNVIDTKIKIDAPRLWSLDTPNMYRAIFSVASKRKKMDNYDVAFGIRTIKFDARKGFFLNGVNTKIKGVNLHHDAGALGAAVPKEIWRYRLQKMKSVGVNAIRMAHNPHSPELMQLCDELGFLVIAEAFDDWERPKDKSVVYLSDNSAPMDIAESYSVHFAQWAERDLKDLIRRDINHPSVIMWSIGNEIEWTFPYYNQSLIFEEEGQTYRDTAPIYDKQANLASLKKNNPHEQEYLALTAKQLSTWVKEIDTSRPVTAGLVLPSVGFASGYTDALDVVGFNYRALEYETAHRHYPKVPIIGSENWGTWDEWSAVKDKDYIPGIFIWTGFAYKGEAGPWPRKGLEISLFDFAGFKTPRGHLFESFWVDKPKTYIATMPAEASEFRFSEADGWVYTERKVEPEAMQWVRPWEWYGVDELWNYNDGENIVAHVYSNTEESELFINGRSLGRQKISDSVHRILLWQLPFESGELKVVGYNKGKQVSTSSLMSHGNAKAIAVRANKKQLLANGYDTVVVSIELQDEHGVRVTNKDEIVHFSVDGPAKLLAVDNGWEYSVQPSHATEVETRRGRAAAFIQTINSTGEIRINVALQSKSAEQTEVKPLTLENSINLSVRAEPDIF